MQKLSNEKRNALDAFEDQTDTAGKLCNQLQVFDMTFRIQNKMMQI